MVVSIVFVVVLAMLTMGKPRQSTHVEGKRNSVIASSQVECMGALNDS